MLSRTLRYGDNDWMDYKIGHAGDDEVTIDLVDTADRASQVLEALQECQEGRCRCPTDQYERLAGMDIARRGGAMRVRLRPRAGERLDMDALRLCLEYTVQRAERDPPP
jgi:hypothetical protein